MRSFFCSVFLFCAFGLGLYAQTLDLRVSFYYEQDTEGWEIFMDNDEYCPVSVQINFQLTNLKSSNGNNKVYVLPARSKKNRITHLRIEKKAMKSSFSTEMQACFGAYNQTTGDDFPYLLPWGKGLEFTVVQGYFGTFSHEGEFSLDFDLPEGTEVYPAREGVVVRVVDSNDKNCKTRKCADYNNYILVYHPDGTFGLYNHLKKGGAMVAEGDEVRPETLLGYSGNVGWSSGPHLHFEVLLFKIDGMQRTLKTKFRTNDGKTQEYLTEGRSYSKAY